MSEKHQAISGNEWVAVMVFFKQSIAAILVILLVGCVGWDIDPVVRKEMTNLDAEVSKINKKNLEKKKYAVINQEKNQTISAKTEDRFDVAVNNMPAKLFFLSLMSGAKRNIVVHPDISGDISLQLKQVTLDELLSVVREIYGYDYKKHGDIYTIYSRTLRTASFYIDYINVKRVGVSDTSVLTGNIESISQANQSEVNANQKIDLFGGGNSINPGARVQTRTEADFWVSIKSAIDELVGVDKNNAENTKKVIVNPQAGVVIVTAMPDELAAVRNFIARAQNSVQKQVIIEAKILEIELSKEFEAGVNWNQINGQLLLGNNVSEFSSPNAIVTASESVGEIFSSLLKVSDIGKLLSLLETQGDVQVLSSPRVSTINNQKAVIRVGTDRFFVTGVSNSTTTSSGSTTNNPDVELSSFFSGISLDVTPQISDENSIVLHIHPVISTVTEEQKQIVVGDSQLSLPLALRDIRESDSIVKAENGQIIVLGGLMQEKSLSTKGKRPGIGDIPVVNMLFKNKRQQQIKSELIILLKPTVVDSDSWKKEVEVRKERITHWGLSTDMRGK